MKIRTSLVAVVLFLLFAGSIASAEPVKVIFDTDISSDVDDCGALAIINALADRGEAELLACVTNGHDQDKACAAAVNVINTWYGRGSVPIGVYHGPHGSVTGSRYTAKLRDEFPHTVLSDDKCPEALAVYRKALADAPDKSVTIISVGFLMNLRDLLESKPDAISPLPGVELIQKKVERLVVMGGQFPNPGKSAEWNFSAPGPGIGEDTKVAINGWPTAILFSGFSIGQGISTGPALAATAKENPVRRAYELFGAMKDGRSSWDPTAALAAIRDPSKYWRVVENGSCVVDDHGINTWTAEPHRGHSYLSPKLDNPTMVKELESLMTAPPKAHEAAK